MSMFAKPWYVGILANTPVITIDRHEYFQDLYE